MAEGYAPKPLDNEVSTKMSKAGETANLFGCMGSIAHVVNGDYVFISAGNADHMRLYGNTGVFLTTNNDIRCVSPTLGSFKPILASAFTVNSSKLIKDNVKKMTDSEAKKILEIDAVSFDFKDGFGDKNQFGVIAEDVENTIPFAVTTPQNYDESTFDISKGANQPIKSVDYSKFIPYLIRMIQIQQKEIDELKSK